MKTYSELMQLATFNERLGYLKLDGSVGFDTFGFDRYLNQILYNSPEWKKVRREVLIRDNGCDLGIEGHTIYKRPLIHHINPITKDDIVKRRDVLFDKENLITVSFDTHNTIHYGSEIPESIFEERTKNDTKLW